MTGRIAQWKEALTARPEDMCSISRTHMWKERINFHLPLYMYIHTTTHTQTHTEENTTNIKMKLMIGL